MPENAGTIYSEIRIEIDKLRGDILKIQNSFDNFAKKNKERSSAVTKNWTESFNQINLAGVAAFAAIGVVVKDGIKTFADFEQSLANVQSVARATPEEFEKLEEAARAAGETTRFTATEAANALYSLASAGLDASEATAALEGVLKLAGATGSDLAFTSATVTAALSQFGLEANESIDVANIFAAAIGNSQANINKLSTSLRQVGQVAGAFGISIENTIGALQALFDAGFQGEQAGTALRNILSSLANESDPTVKKLKALGIAFDDLNPAVNSVADIIGNLSDANIEAGQIIAAFGREAGPALLSLLEVGKKGLESYTDAVTGTNAASEAYAIQMNTLQGDLAELRSSVESVAISFVKEFAPAIRGVVNILTSIVRAVNALPGPLKVFFGILLTGIPAIAGLSSALNLLKTIFSVSLGPVALFVTAIAGTVSIVTALVRASDTAARKQEQLNKTSGELTKTLDEYKEVTSKLKDAIKQGNKEEAETLRIRQELLKNQLAANLKEDIKAINAIEKETKKQNKTLNRLNDRYDDANKEVAKYNKSIQDAIRFGDQFSSAARNAEFELGGWKNEVKLTGEELNKQKVIIGELNLARENAINQLARAVASGQIEIIQIKEYDNAVAEEVATRAKKLNKQKENIQSTKEETDETEELIEKEEKLKQNQDDKISRQKELEERVKAANEAAAETTQNYIEKLEDLDATESELIELQRQRVQAEIESSDASLEAKVKAIDASDKYFNALQKESSAYKDISDQTATYEFELLRLVGTEQEIIEAERQRAIATAKASGASIDAIENQVTIINQLYDKLIEKAEESASKQKKSFTDYFDAALGAFRNFTAALDESFKSSADKQISEIERTLDNNLKSIDQRLQKELAAKGLLEETESERLKREIAEATTAGDLITAQELQNELDRLQIAKKYEDERIKAKEEAERKSSQLEYKAALASWKLKINDAIANAAAAITNIWATWAANPIIAGTLTLGAAAATGLQLKTINEAKPEAPGFQTGGIVLPSGSSGQKVTVAENNAPELLLNAGPEGQSFLNQFADRVARAIGIKSGGPGAINIAIDIDGRRIAETSAKYYNNGNIPLRMKL